MEHLNKKELVKLREGCYTHFRAASPWGLNVQNQPAEQRATEAKIVSIDPELMS